jgi:periplasmic copper chaperone A
MKLIILFFVLLNLQEDKILVENNWIRNSAKGMNTALFFDVTNNGEEADTLYKASSDLAELVQIHETYKKGDMMGMREISKVVIEANSTFKFKPRAHHVMLINLKEDLKTGDEGEVTLYFSKAGEIKISSPVKSMKMD